jgi:hypothetical protein
MANALRVGEHLKGRLAATGSPSAAVGGASMRLVAAP